MGRVVRGLVVGATLVAGAGRGYSSAMYGSPTHRRFDTLPEPIDLTRVVCVHDPDPAPDPEVGRDANQDFMLRNAG